MTYADEKFYEDKYLLGRQAIIPPSEFLYFARKASTYIDMQTMNRLKEVDENDILEEVKQCTCELAEYYFIAEDSIGKSSESVSGRSVTYAKGEDRSIVYKYLANTGLLFRGVR